MHVYIQYTDMCVCAANTQNNFRSEYELDNKLAFNNEACGPWPRVRVLSTRGLAMEASAGQGEVEQFPGRASEHLQGHVWGRKPTAQPSEGRG